MTGSILPPKAPFSLGSGGVVRNPGAPPTSLSPFRRWPSLLSSAPFAHFSKLFIDSRFYRSKYDATQTVEAFSARLRDEVDIDTLTKDLLAVVQDSMQPRSVSLWLRGSSDSAATSAHG
jgi:hypothetical protein